MSCLIGKSYPLVTINQSALYLMLLTATRSGLLKTRAEYGWCRNALLGRNRNEKYTVYISWLSSQVLISKLACHEPPKIYYLKQFITTIHLISSLFRSFFFIIQAWDFVFILKMHKIITSFDNSMRYFRCLNVYFSKTIWKKKLLIWSHGILNRFID